MISVSNLALSYGQRTLFKEVNLKFNPGNCYGVIGANGAGKSTFLGILSGTIDYDKGEISLGKDQRMAVLRQDHFAFEQYRVLDAVIMGYPKLYDLMKERDELYSKASMSDEEGMRAGEVESEFGEIGGY
jgi:ATPase subunit of ABC transporter with duplicated ATPase domains